MTYSREQLIDALAGEYEYLCHDCPEDDDLTDAEYRERLSTLTYDELVDETVTDDEFTLDEFIYAYS